MWTHLAGVLLLLTLAVSPSAATSDPEGSSRDPAATSSPEGSSGNLSAATAAESERRQRAVPLDDGDKQPKHVLPINKQVSAFLPGQQYKRFLYRQRRDGAAISLVVTPCSAELKGNITFYPDNVREGGKTSLVVRKIEGPDQVIYSARRGEPGDYDINITAKANTYVHFLASDEDLSGLSSLQKAVTVKSRSKSRAEISWSPGSHGGQALRYCLITSSTRHFSSVCGGLSAKFGQQPPDGTRARRRRQQVALSSGRQRAVQNPNITVGCVGKNTVYTLYDLVPGRQYHVTVFGQYVNRSVSFQYGTAKFRYQDMAVRTTLKIRQNRVSRLRLTPARPFRSLELRGPSQRERIYYFVVSCDVPLSLRIVSNYSGTGWEGHSGQVKELNVPSAVLISGDFNTSHLATQDTYQFELLATGGATVVEFQATWRLGRLRVAKLPHRANVRAVRSRRRRKLGLNCTQLALRMPRSQGRRLEYCVILEPDRSGRTGRLFKAPSACGLETRLQHSPANMTRCGSSKELRRGKRVEVIFDGLTAGQTYVVRAMVRPRTGRFVPYNLAQVTVPPCPDELPNELTESSVSKLEPIREWVTSNREAPASGSNSGPISSQLQQGVGAEPPAADQEAAEEADNALNDWS